MTLRHALAALAPLFVLAAAPGCAFFGTQDGLESDGGASAFGRNVEGLASFDVLGVSPAAAEPGEQTTVYTVSEEDAPTTSFAVEDFWFCTFDGEAAMLETGGDEYTASLNADDVVAIEDLGLTLDDVEGGTLSSVTFTVPEGSVTGDGLLFTPSGDQRDFFLAIGGN